MSNRDYIDNKLLYDNVMFIFSLEESSNAQKNTKKF